MVAMDSSVIIFLVLFPLKYDQIEQAQRKAAGFDGMLPKCDTIFKSLYSKLLCGLRL